MYAITFRIFPWDTDAKWARVKVILVKGDEGVTFKFKLCPMRPIFSGYRGH